ncbi:MAG: hypothetical protein ABJV04_11000 [Aliiglaciecola sp.]|uniref:hypothetical protein n=1 Tax=Aliiglaciecola sp. TaxID=1872441 RepID=UPI003299A9AA
MKKYLSVLVTLITFNSFAHQGHVDDTALLACTEKQKSDPCAYVASNLKLHKGSCQQFNQHFICVRNQPLETVTDKELAKLRSEGEVAISAWLSKQHEHHEDH